jgi:hypothetical protein
MNDLGELRDVIRLVLSQEHDDVRITLVALEVYDAGSLLHLHLRLGGDREFPVGRFRGPRGPEPAISVADAQGPYAQTNYMMAGGSRKEWRFSYVFTPPLRPSAEVLHVNVEEIAMTLTTPDGGERRESWPGPWEFEVPLSQPVPR